MVARGNQAATIVTVDSSVPQKDKVAPVRGMRRSHTDLRTAYRVWASAATTRLTKNVVAVSSCSDSPARAAMPAELSTRLNDHQVGLLSLSRGRTCRSGPHVGSLALRVRQSVGIALPPSTWPFRRRADEEWVYACRAIGP